MTLLELFALMKKHLALVIALPVAFAVLTAVYCFFFMPNQYTASTSIYVLTTSSTSTTGISSSDLSASQMLTNDVATLIKSTRVQSKAAEAAHFDSLSGFDISVTSSTTTRIITVAVTSPSAANSALIANQLAKTADSIAQEVMDVQSINVIDEASVPTSPSGPPRTMYTAVAFLAGLFLAIAIIVIADMANTRVRSSEEAAELTGLPVIGRIPTIKA